MGPQKPGHTCEQANVFFKIIHNDYLSIETKRWVINEQYHTLIQLAFHNFSKLYFSKNSACVMIDV